jgi:hypothetical protein
MPRVVVPGALTTHLAHTEIAALREVRCEHESVATHLVLVRVAQSILRSLASSMPQFPKHWQKTISDNGGGADGLTPPMDDGDD